MVETSYRTNLYNSKNLLEDFGQQLFGSLINIAMSGEMKNFDDGFDLGEVVVYNDADFRHLEDQNVKLIYEVLDVIHNVRNSLININNLDSGANENNEDTPF